MSDFEKKLSQKEKIKLVTSEARNDLISFSMLIDPSYKPNWHHEEIAKKLMAVERGEIKRLMIFCPPRHGKSELSTVNFPIWYLGRNPNKEVITASYSEVLASDFGKKSREKVADVSYQAIFGHTLKEGEKSKMKWGVTNGGTYTSVGIGGALTGRGANLLLIDDPIKSFQEAESSVIRDMHWEWYRTVALTRLMKDAAIVLTLTRWHTDDLAGRLLEQMEFGGDQWEVVKYPAIATCDEEFRSEGEALWENQFPLAQLQKTRSTQGVYNWSSLYQQEPITSENQLFQRTWFKYRDEGEVDALSTRNYLVVDTAVSQSDKADYTGFCDNSVDKEEKWNLRAWRVRITPMELIDTLFSLHSKRHYVRIGIEIGMYQKVMKPFLEAEMRKRGVYLPIYEIKRDRTSKESRIRFLEPRYSSGSIYHIRGRCNDLEDELLLFPKAKHDDVSDAAADMSQIVTGYSEMPKAFAPIRLTNYR